MVSTTYTIQMASKISGVGVHTIRAWEKRYKALEPVRDASGHRTYSKTDVEKLMLLSELCLLGYTISKVAGLTIPELKEQLLNLGKTEESLAAQDFSLINDTKLTFDPAQSLPILLFALKSFKLDVISLELAKLKTIITSRDFALEIIAPMSQTLSEMLTQGSITRDQEQAARAILKFHIGFNLYHPLERKENSILNIIVSGMEGDANDLGIGMVALLCGHYGFHYTYLGSDISYEALSESTKSLEANLVIIGPTNVYQQLGRNHFQNYIEKLALKLPPATELVVAGKSELDVEKISSKRLVILKNLSAVDEYLAEKNN